MIGMRWMARRWLVVSVLCWVVGASPGHAQELLSTNAGRTILAGPNAVGGIGDWALQNGTVCAVVAARAVTCPSTVQSSSY